MTSTLTNFIQLTNKGLFGNVAMISFDVDIVGEPVASNNERAPKYRLFSKSPRGRQVEIGGIWERENRKGKPYFSLTITVGQTRYYANLGRYPGQDDDTLYAVIHNQYDNTERRS